MQALWRVQAHMLARIVVEIRAADIAVELERYSTWYTCTRVRTNGTIWYSSTMVWQYCKYPQYLVRTYVHMYYMCTYSRVP